MFYRSVLHHRQFRYLGAFYLHSLVRLFAVSIFQIFSSIYIFQTLRGLGVEYQHSLGITSLFFSVVFLIQALAVAPSLWLTDKKGLRFSVFWGNIFLIVFFTFLYLGGKDPIFLFLAALAGGLQIGLYWTAYHIYFAKLTDDKRQGEELAISGSLSAVAAIGGPAFGGLIISYGGFGSVFVVMGILIALANLPLKYLPKQKDTISVDILATFKALSPKPEIKSYLSLASVGVIDSVGLYFWPIFVFSILSGYVGLGFMGSLVALISTVTTICLGLFIDKVGPQKAIRVLSPLDSLLWVARTFITTPFHVFLVSGLQAMTIAGQFISLDSMIYERARHNNLVAFIVQREIGLAIGRSIFLILMGILLWFGLPLVMVFIFSALLTLATRLYPKEEVVVQEPSSKQLISG